MKYILLISFLTFFQNNYSQHNTNCNPLSNYDFEVIFNKIKSNKNPQSRYKSIDNLIKDNCLFVNQYLKLSHFLNNDIEKFQMTSKIYNKILDKENFYDLLDIYSSKSYAFRFYDFAKNFESKNQFSTNNTNNDKDYNNNFNTFLYSLDNLNDRQKARKILDYSFVNSYTSQNVFDMCSLIKDGDIVHDLLQRLYNNTSDKEHYSINFGLMNKKGINNINDFLNDKKNITTIHNVCTITDNDFNSKLTILKTNKFDSDLVLQINVFFANKCLSSSQINSLLSLSKFDDTRLEIAKNMYKTCIDKDNYLILKNSFQFSSSFDDLTQFIYSQN